MPTEEIITITTYALINMEEALLRDDNKQLNPALLNILEEKGIKKLYLYTTKTSLLERHKAVYQSAIAQLKQAGKFTVQINAIITPADYVWETEYQHFFTTCQDEKVNINNILFSGDRWDSKSQITALNKLLERPVFKAINQLITAPKTLPPLGMAYRYTGNDQTIFELLELFAQFVAFKKRQDNTVALIFEQIILANKEPFQSYIIFDTAANNACVQHILEIYKEKLNNKLHISTIEVACRGSEIEKQVASKIIQNHFNILQNKERSGANLLLLRHLEKKPATHNEAQSISAFQRPAAQYLPIESPDDLLAKQLMALDARYKTYQEEAQLFNNLLEQLQNIDRQLLPDENLPEVDDRGAGSSQSPRVQTKKTLDAHQKNLQSLFSEYNHEDTQLQSRLAALHGIHRHRHLSNEQESESNQNIETLLKQANNLLHAMRSCLDRLKIKKEEIERTWHAQLQSLLLSSTSNTVAYAVSTTVKGAIKKVTQFFRVGMFHTRTLPTPATTQGQLLRIHQEITQCINRLEKKIVFGQQNKRTNQIKITAFRELDSRLSNHDNGHLDLIQIIETWREDGRKHDPRFLAQHTDYFSHWFRPTVSTYSSQFVERLLVMARKEIASVSSHVPTPSNARQIR